MKIKFTIITLLLLNAFNLLYAQSSLDIVRASNHYTNAVQAYENRNYNSALSYLRQSEENLRGNTNRDLEFLKIMSNYRLQQYPAAYELVQRYFEVGFRDRTTSYRNIDTYREKHRVSYEEILTEIFVDLENRFGVVTNLTIEEVGQSIISRINETPYLWDFLENSTRKSFETRLLTYRILCVNNSRVYDCYRGLSTLNVIMRRKPLGNRARSIGYEIDHGSQFRGVVGIYYEEERRLTNNYFEIKHVEVKRES